MPPEEEWAAGMGQPEWCAACGVIARIPGCTVCLPCFRDSMRQQGHWPPDDDPDPEGWAYYRRLMTEDE